MADVTTEAERSWHKFSLRWLDPMIKVARIKEHERKRWVHSEQRFIVFFDTDDDLARVRVTALKMIWVAPSFLSNWKANSKSMEICAKIQFMITTWWCDGKKKSNLPPPHPSGKYSSNRLHGGYGKFLKRGCIVPTLSEWKGQHFLWMVYERVILPDKKRKSVSKSKR